MKTKLITTNTTNWMKKGKLIWHSEPTENPNLCHTELMKVVKVHSKTQAEIRSLYWIEKVFWEIKKWYHLNIGNPVKRRIYDYKKGR